MWMGDFTMTLPIISKAKQNIPHSNQTLKGLEEEKCVFFMLSFLKTFQSVHIDFSPLADYCFSSALLFVLCLEPAGSAVSLDSSW